MATRPPATVDEWEDVPANSGDEWEDIPAAGGVGTDQQDAAYNARSPEQRFLSNVADALVPSWEATKTFVGAAMNPIKAAGAWMDVFKGAESNSAAEQAKAAELEGAGRPWDARLHRFAAIPVIGPMVAKPIEQIEQGDVAGGLGRAVGSVLPFTKPLKALGLGKRAAGALEASAGESTLQAIKATPAVGEKLVQSGQLPVIQEALGVGGRATLAKRAAAELAEARAELNAIKAGSAETALDVRPVAQRLRSAAPEVKLGAGAEEATVSPETAGMESLPVTRSLTPEEVTQLANMTPDQRLAYLAKLKGGPAPAAGAAVSLDPALATAVKKQATAIERLAEAFPDGTPARELFTLRSQAGHAAARGGAYSKLPGQVTSAGADASKQVQAVLADTLESQIPGLVAADIKTSTWINVSDALQKAVQTERMGGPSAAEIFSVRALMGTTAGAAGGAALGLGTGGIAGMGLAGYGAWRIAAGLVNSPIWHTLSAEGRLLLAQSLRNGIGQYAGRTSVVAGHLPLGHRANEQARITPFDESETP